MASVLSYRKITLKMLQFLHKEREIQAAHYCHSQATIFTAHAWIDNETNESIVVISDDLNHTKYGGVYISMQYICRCFKAKCSSIETYRCL